MDILDEIDAAILEKKSKWNYTPMREKSETDAIIDELLREFSPEGSYRAKPAEKASYRPVKKPDAMNDEQEERRIYNEAAAHRTHPEYHDSVFVGRKQEYQEEESDGYSEEYGEEYDEDEEGYEDGESGGGFSGSDFDRFMDAENDGEKGDIPRFPISKIIFTILKILVLAVFGAFAVTGILNTVNKGMDKLKDSGSGRASLKDELGKVIYPIIVTGIADFDSPSELDDEQLVLAAVWELVINGNKSVFEDKETGKIVIPQEQMTYIVEKLFGEGTEFSHTSAELDGIAVEYDKDKKQYTIADDTDLFTLYPKVTDIAETDSGYIVYADCYRMIPAWEDERSSPVNIAMITLVKTSDYYNIASLKTIPAK